MQTRPKVSKTTLRLRKHTQNDATRALLTKAGISPVHIERVLRHVGLGMPTKATLKNAENYLLARNEYVTSYSRSRRTPNWVSWHFTKSDLAVRTRKKKFRSDATLPKHWKKAKSSDYTNSGYSRGHIVGSGERQNTRRANSKTFVLSNILPQLHENNSGPWFHLESYCRDLVGRENKDVYFVAGGLYEGETQTIGKNKIAVPSATWKVAVIVDRGVQPSEMNANTRVISIIVPNQKGSVQIKQPFMDFRVSPKEIESRAKVSLFTHLPPKVSAVLRNKIDKEFISRSFQPLEL